MDDEIVVLVTGASRGLGRVMALALIDDRCKVVFTGTSEDVLQQVVKEAGLEAHQYAAIVADLSIEADRDQLLDQALKRFGRVDVLVNNAAFTPEHLWPNFEIEGEAPTWTIDVDVVRRFFEINSIAPHHLASALIPGMIDRGWGRIVNVSTSLDTMLRFWPYGGTKASVESHIAVLAKHLEGTGVTANALLPGGFTKPEPLRDKAGRVIRPVLPPSNMVAPIRWLCSKASDGVSGRRIVAAQWDASLPDAKALSHASYPVAWTGLGTLAARPDD